MSKQTSREHCRRGFDIGSRSTLYTVVYREYNAVERPQGKTVMTIRSALYGLALALFAVPSLAHAQEEQPDPVDAPLSAVGEAGDDTSGERRRELRSVEEEVDQLKERVFRSKATLQLLKELVLEGSSAGSRLVLWHVNSLGGGFSLESVSYFVDGRNVFTKVDPGGQLDASREFEVHSQTLPAGKHRLQVSMVLRGNGSGVFSYLRSYQLKVRSEQEFTIEDGKVTTLKVIAGTKGPLKAYDDRPTIRYEERLDTLREE